MRPASDPAGLLREVSAALGRAGAPPREPQPDPSVARTCGPTEDLASIFCERARASGMAVHEVRCNELRADLACLLKRLGVSTAAVGEVHGCDVRAACSDAGARVVDWREGPGMLPFFDPDAGITDVQGAIAETGSLVCESGPGRARGLSLAPPVHIAVVRASQVVPDLLDWAAGERRGLPACVTLVSGPSKTADIEGVLVTGVHGPRQVHVLLVRDG